MLYANTSSPDVYWKTANPAGPFGTMPQVPWHSKGPDKMLNPISISISTVAKCATMQVIKQPEHRKPSTTKEQKCTSLQMNYD